MHIKQNKQKNLKQIPRLHWYLLQNYPKSRCARVLSCESLRGCVHHTSSPVATIKFNFSPNLSKDWWNDCVFASSSQKTHRYGDTLGKERKHYATQQTNKFIIVFSVVMLQSAATTTKKLLPDHHDHHHQLQAGRHSDPIRSHTTSRRMEIEIYCVAFVSFCRFFHPALALLWPCPLWLAGCTWTSSLCFIPMVLGPGCGRDMYVTLNSCIWFSASTIIEAKAQNMMVTATCSMFSMASAGSLALCSLCWWIVSYYPSACSAALCFCYSRNNCRVLCSTVHRAMFVRRYHRCPSFWVWI